MMAIRKLDGAVDKSSADQKNLTLTRSYITCERSGGLHLVEPGLMAGRQVVRQTKFERGLKF